MERVSVGILDANAYRGIAADNILDEIASLSHELNGLRVAHLNATPSGGGVAEILMNFVPLMRGVGLDAEWWVLDPDNDFFEVTKRIHNMLQGQPGELSREEVETYLLYNEKTARQMEALAVDVWVIHDPQPVATIAYHKNLHPAIWRCHIDTSSPNETVRDLLLPYISSYDHVVFSLEDFAFPGIPLERLRFITPAIDALVAKNAPIDRAYARKVVHQFGPKPDRPLVTQISRFDPWKDPIGVVDAYRLAREQVPGLQLALVGMTARDDPEAARIFSEVNAHVGVDPDVYLLTERNGVRNFEVNAFQTASDVIIQKSLREGFGLTVSEAMWKGTPVVGGRAGGIVRQIQDGVDGYLVSSVEEAADRILRLLKDKKHAQEMGIAAREHVRKEFLMPTLLLNYMRMLKGISTIFPRSNPVNPITTPIPG